MAFLLAQVGLLVGRCHLGEDPRYIHLEGSHSHPMVLHPKRDILIVVESALDGFLLGQEAGNLAGVVILGSAQAQPDKELTAILRRRRLILLALDADPPGAKARRWWLEKLPNSRRWPPIRGKDPGEMLEQGIDLRLWIEVGIARFLDEITETEEEENELPFSGSGHPESQFQVAPALGEAIGSQEYQAQVLFPEPLSEVNEGRKISQGYDGDDKSEPTEVGYTEHAPATCFECAHFRPAVKSPNSTQAWGFCEKRKRGRYGVATACKALLVI